MEFKNTDRKHVKDGLHLKDLDTSKGTAQVYLASFGNIDYDRDVIQKGAFTKTIQERFSSNNIKFLMYHDMTRPAGVITDLMQDNFGLLANVKLSKNRDGSDLLIMYEEGTIDQHSIGFDIIKANDEVVNDQKVQIIKEVRLWEGSAVTFGANPNTPVVEVKSVLSKMERLLKRGDLSDQELEKLEKQYKAIGTLLFAERPQQDERQSVSDIARSILL